MIELLLFGLAFLLASNLDQSIDVPKIKPKPLNKLHHNKIIYLCAAFETEGKRIKFIKMNFNEICNHTTNVFDLGQTIEILEAVKQLENLPSNTQT